MNLTFDDDGEFYMSMEDFMRNFDELEVCNLTNTAIDDDVSGKLVWHESKAHGSWVKGRIFII